MDKISVIIPNYGHAGRIMDAVQSILDQSYTEFEILILNDDERSLKAFEKIDSRIKVYDRIDGIKHTSEYRLNTIAHQLQEYWAYQDADGLSYPGRLELSLHFLKTTMSDIITTDGVYIFKDLMNERYKYTELDLEYNVGAMSGVFAKRDILLDVPFSKEGYGSDGPWWYEIQQRGFRYFHLDIPLYKHLDYSSRFRKFKNIPVLRKLYRLLILKPELKKHMKQLRQDYDMKLGTNY